MPAQNTVQPTGASPEFPPFNGANLADQSGLSTGYTNGVSDFASYLAGGVTHSSTTGNTYISVAGTTTYYVRLDLGNTLTIESMAFWNLGGNDPSNVIDFTLLADINFDFPNPTILGSFTADPNTGPNAAVGVEVFNFAPIDTRYVRLQIDSNNGGINTGFGEVVFNRVVPEIDLQPGDKYHLVFATSFTTDVSSSTVVPPVPFDFGGIEAASWLTTFAVFNGSGNWTMPFEVRQPDVFGAGGWNGVDVVARSVLSDSTSIAVDHVNIQGKVFNTAGQLLANGSSDFFDGSLFAPVNYDESGNLLSTTTGEQKIWCGNSQGGTHSGASCGDWDLSDTGASTASFSSLGWISGPIADCNNDSARLFGMTPALTVPFPNPLAAQLVTTGTVSLSQDARVPPDPTTLSFDYRFTTTTGNLTVTFDGVLLGTVAAPATLTGDFTNIQFAVDPDDLPASQFDRFPIEFALDGVAGSTLLLDNIVYEFFVGMPQFGMANFDFQRQLVSWNSKSGVDAVSVLFGDTNGDGAINLLDVDSFIVAIGTGDYDFRADTNQDGAVNLLDIDPFIVLLSGG